MGLIMVYFYLCDRANVFMKEQKFYTHSTFFIPLIYMFVLGIFYSENSKEVRGFGMECLRELKKWYFFAELFLGGGSLGLHEFRDVSVLNELSLTAKLNGPCLT